MPYHARLLSVASLVIAYHRFPGWLLAWLTALMVVAASATALLVERASSPDVAVVHLSSGPLYAPAGGDKAAIALALSVEYPTVGAQYVAQPDQSTDNTYANTNEYLGYYDAESCYVYNDSPVEKLLPGQVPADYKRFDRQGPAGSGQRQRMCSDGFSGNFLNWASGSAIDMLRLALSGGDRWLDTSELTVLQRAVIPDGDPVCMWNSSNFPAKQLSRAGGGTGGYWGAIPAVMATEAAGRDIWVANTLNRIYFGTSAQGSCNATGAYRLGGPDVHTSRAGLLNSDGFFYARVQVCDTSEGVLQDQRDYGLCSRYPKGNFKPVGSIQKYSDRLRLAAFGYVMDQTASYSGGRYGGVLRAPMKYVGARTFDITGQDSTPEGGNPQAEWFADTGVFKTNPDGDESQAVPVSGVINYLNRFGRTGPKAGRYKLFDPVGELHYEALRYLQGLPPSPAAVGGISTVMEDGFPVFRNWTDPYGDGRSSKADHSCLKSNILVIGDVNSHDGNRIPAPDVAGNVPDINAWRSVVQGFEKNQDRPYTDGQGILRRTGNPNPSNPGVNSGPQDSQLLGTAYWAHTQDIRGRSWTAREDLQRPGLRVKSFFFDVNEYGTSNREGYRRANNQFFTGAKYGGFESQPATASSAAYNSWGNPFRREDARPDNDVWQDPARPGEARTYFRQSDARSVLTAFDSIFGEASTRMRSIAGTALSSRSLSPGGVMSFQAVFDTADWSGDVIATTVNVSATSTVTATATPAWSAAARLAAMAFPALERKIVVGNSQGSPLSTVASTFTWAAIEPALRDHLMRASPDAVPDGLGQLRLDFLRGDRSREGREFRLRQQLLGDIINSGVVHAGAPTVFTGPSATYPAFRLAHGDRAKAVYVGANDGMLHAFNAESGDELFAYIPSWMGSRLSALTDKGYAANHQSYVDATPAVGEAQVAEAGQPELWKTMLVSGTGAGGPGVFALDVTDPAAFSAASVQWEFTRADDADLGQVVGQPQIVKLRTSAAGKPVTYRWFAMVAGGVNNHVAQRAFGTARSRTGRPALFLLALDKPAGVAWRADGDTPNYYRLSLPMDEALAATVAPGLINFTVTRGRALEVDKVYMGDLHGRLWKLDFSARMPAAWNFSSLSAFREGDSVSATPRPLFITGDAGGIQPISMAPSVLNAATTGAPGRVQVAFVTGKYLEASDKSASTRQSIYVLHDDGHLAADASPPGASWISGRNRLQAGTVHTDTFEISVPAFVWGTPRSDDDQRARAGWYADLPGAGERAISAGVARGDTWLFETLMPAPNLAGVCAMEAGTGRHYQVRLRSGSGTWAPSAYGLPAASLMLELPSATFYTTSTSTGRRVRVTTTPTWTSGSAGGGPGSSHKTESFAGRLSWRQINNYRELKNAP
ncbi:MAG: PilC/PilY family type IV pilus protein [Polaromonas sp.]|nr:PilC/PilY family type IV pilus protein [Polaromonas sp.]